MKNLIYLIELSNHNDKKSYGPIKKVEAQMKSFRTVCDVTLINHDPNKKGVLSIVDKIKSRLPFMPITTKWEYDERFTSADFIYIRRPSFFDHSLYKLLKKIKQKNPKVKIILEHPTYPYLSQLMAHGFWKQSLFILKDIINHHLIAYYLDRITTFSEHEKIAGVKTIRIMNGVDFSSINMPVRENVEDKIELIEVSSVNFWHGYDRILEGMGQYYKTGGKRNIIFNIVGDGMVIPQFKQIVEKYHLEDHVVFYGNKGGKELEDIYRHSYIGIDALGRHRSNNPTNSSLKSREYAAYGIPLVAAVPIDFADKDWPYVAYVPQDESPIDMEQIIAFYDSIYRDKDANAIATEIRDYGKSRCDMSITMQPVVDYIQEEN